MARPKAHATALARLMREQTGHARWRSVPHYAAIHDVVGAALDARHASAPLRGAGLSDWISKAKDAVGEAAARVKNFVSGARDGFSPPAAKMLAKHADWLVSSLVVRRDPIQSALNTAFNLVTLGKWNEARAKYSFDKLFHLGLVVGLTSPTGQHAELLIEKNAVVNVGHTKAQLDSSEVMRVPAPRPPRTLATFVDNAKRAMGSKFFSYSAFSNNCQDFVRALLSSNGVLTPGADKFLKQDLEQLIKEQPGYTGAVADAVTDLGARADRLVNGGRLKAPRKTRARARAPSMGGALGFSKEMRDMGVKTEEDYLRFTKWLEADNEQQFAAEKAAKEEAAKHPHVEGVRPWKFIKLAGEAASHVPGLRAFGKAVSKGADVGEEWAGGHLAGVPVGRGRCAPDLDAAGSGLFGDLWARLKKYIFVEPEHGSDAYHFHRNLASAREWHRQTFRD